MATSNGERSAPTELPPRNHDQHREWLLEITQLPTAAGREWRVVNWIRAWVAARPELALDEDRAGNLVVRPRRAWGSKGVARGKSAAPIFITAHLDHPAFVVHRVIGPGTLELAFRGGVNDEYFLDARVTIHAGGPDVAARPELRLGATLTGEGAGVVNAAGERLFKTYLAEIDGDGGSEGDDPEVKTGDVATWELPPAVIDAAGIVHTHACDDLSAVAAALSAYDALLAGVRAGSKVQDVRLLFTRSEEIGFTGAIAACKLKTMPKGSRVIALENSRSFADSPIGGGPIVRVGDRLTIFSPSLTAACGKRAEQLAGRAAAPTATQRVADFAGTGGMKWQRKLMAGGACEATVYCAYGYESTCLCLPLGNYHNMSHLQAVQDGTFDRTRLGPPRVGPEYISLADYHGLVDLLVGIGVELPQVDPINHRIERLYALHAFVLEEGRDAGSVDSRIAARVRAKRAAAGARSGSKAGGKTRSGARAAAKR